MLDKLGLKPMTAAPHDGTPILVRGGHPDLNADCAKWDGETADFTYNHPSEWVVVWWDTGRDCWRYCSYDNRVYGEWHDPQGWTDLPICS
jgi:hypothetical protein